MTAAAEMEEGGEVVSRGTVAVRVMEAVGAAVVDGVGTEDEKGSVAAREGMEGVEETAVLGQSCRRMKWPALSFSPNLRCQLTGQSQGVHSSRRSL
jgi:hypothetical protein